jgi:hypothetical protein
MSENQAKIAAITQAEKHLRELQESPGSIAGSETMAQDVSTSGAFPNLLESYMVPIQIPSRSNLSVRLVPMDWLDRFEEYKDKQAETLAILGILLSSLLAVLMLVVTGESKGHRSVGIIGVLLLAGSLYIARDYFQARKRSQKLKEEMIQAFPTEDEIAAK